MKKRLVSLFLALFLLCSVLPAGAAGEPIGNVEDLLSTISAYLSAWKELIGDAEGVDFTFDPTNTYTVNTEHADTNGNMVSTVSYHGIIMDVDRNGNVYQIKVEIASDSWAPASIARVIAVVNTIAFDFPADDEEMTRRFSETFEDYLNTLEKTASSLSKSFGMDFWIVENDMNTEFFILSKDFVGRLYLKYYR